MTMAQHGRVALVTGAAGGLGQAFALRLAATGHQLVLTDRAPCTALLAQLHAAGAADAVVDLPCELSQPDAVQAFAARVLAQVGRVDVLVSNAAFYTGQVMNLDGGGFGF